MLTPEHTTRHRSPGLWALYAVCLAFTAELVAVAVWNAWENREQLLDQAVRRLHH